MPGRDADDLMADVGRRVGDLRRKASLTQADLAEHLDVSPQYLRRIENGRANLTLRSLARLANPLDVDAAQLLRKPRSRAPRPRGRPTSRQK